MNAEASPAIVPVSRLRVLDSLRGIGAVLVVLYHFEIWNHAFPTPWFRHVMSLMDFFFVLSGLVISMGFYERIRNGRECAGYLIRRVGRIWPLHVTMLLAFLGLEIVKLFAAQLGFAPANTAFEGPKSVASFFGNVFMVHAWNLYGTLTWNYPSWSISVEFAAYIAFGLFALAHPRRPVVTALLIVALAVFVVWRFAPAYMNSDIDYGVPRCLAGFFLGHVLYQIQRRFVVGRTWRIPCATAVEGVTLLMAGLYIGFISTGPVTLVAPLFYACLIFVFSLEDGWFSAQLGRERIRLLGEWSYSIYMVHAFLLMLVTAAFKLLEKGAHRSLTVPAMDGARKVELWNFGGQWGGDLVTLLFVAATIFIASRTYRYVEEPGRRWFNKLAARVAGEPPRAAQPTRNEAAEASELRPLPAGIVVPLRANGGKRREP